MWATKHAVEMAAEGGVKFTPSCIMGDDALPVDELADLFPGVQFKRCRWHMEQNLETKFGQKQYFQALRACEICLCSSVRMRSLLFVSTSVHRAFIGMSEATHEHVLVDRWKQFQVNFPDAVSYMSR